LQLKDVARRARSSALNYEAHNAPAYQMLTNLPVRRVIINSIT